MSLWGTILPVFIAAFLQLQFKAYNTSVGLLQ